MFQFEYSNTGGQSELTATNSKLVYKGTPKPHHALSKYRPTTLHNIETQLMHANTHTCVFHSYMVGVYDKSSKQVHLYPAESVVALQQQPKQSSGGDGAGGGAGAIGSVCHVLCLLVVL